MSMSSSMNQSAHVPFLRLILLDPASVSQPVSSHAIGMNDSDQDSLASVCRFRAPARPSDLGAVAAEGAGGYLADEVLATLDAEVTKAGL